MTSTAALARMIDQCDRIVFFGGAGVSTESGIPDFHSADGLYSQTLGRDISAEEIVSHSFFTSHPDQFFDYYRRHLVYPAAQPNQAHRALASLERAGKVSAVVTQNIDGLHQRAGSHVVWELHGSIWRNHCVRCSRSYDLDAILSTSSVPYCECGGVVKPDVVLYEESLDEGVIDGALNALSQADLLIIGGTSLVVYPAAGLIRYFHGDHMVLINKEPTPADRHADLVIHAPIGATLSPWA
ncbi:MAG: NAD-dependent protein deacylase [Propionibacteriaceae bacterium]|nr:NAD-dependent protein deacylase [Propionibacteriaceae bacterium]